jgi:predicted nuclease of restriction endonuclease-like (RecB) superfamily
MLSKEFKNTINEIKNQINNTQIEIFQNANKSLLNLYYNLGKIIDENSSWGNKFIDELAIELKVSFPNIKGFSVRNLKNMKKYYIECQKNQFVQTASAQIPWSHNILILDKVKDDQKRVWYMNQTLANGWSYDVLAFQIKSDLYQRQVLNEKSNNFQKTLINPQSDLARNIMKDPYILNLTTLKENYIETELEAAMVNKIKTVLLELGNGFSFIGNQYKITVGEEDYFIDMLFYHTKLHCYIVVELKNTKFKPEYAGKVNFYLSAVDDLIKDEQDNPSIGIILCREKDKFSVEYSLKDINKPIGVSSYEISKYLPKDVLESLPTEDDINLHIDIEEEDENNE